MSDATRVRQSKAGYRRDFAFGAERVTCAIRDSSGERRFSLAYESIDVTSTSTWTLNSTPMVRTVFSVGLVLAIPAFLDAAHGPGSTLPHPVALAIFSAGLIAVGVALANRWTRWLSVTFTLMPMAPPPGVSGPLMVIHDRHHDAVIETLRVKWQDRMRALHGRANLHGDPTKEAARLAWLRDQGVIDDVRYRDEMERLNASGREVTPSVRRLN